MAVHDKIVLLDMLRNMNHAIVYISHNLGITTGRLLENDSSDITPWMSNIQQSMLKAYGLLSAINLHNDFVEKERRKVQDSADTASRDSPRAKEGGKV